MDTSKEVKMKSIFIGSQEKWFERLLEGKGRGASESQDFMLWGAERVLFKQTFLPTTHLTPCEGLERRIRSWAIDSQATLQWATPQKFVYSRNWDREGGRERHRERWHQIFLLFYFINTSLRYPNDKEDVDGTDANMEKKKLLFVAVHLFRGIVQRYGTRKEDFWSLVL